MVIQCILVLEISSLLEFPMKQTLGQAWVQAVNWKPQETSAEVSSAGPRNRAGSVKGLVGDQGAVWRGSSGSWCETHAWESPYLRAGEVTYRLLSGGPSGGCGLLQGQPAAHAERHPPHCGDKAVIKTRFSRGYRTITKIFKSMLQNPNKWAMCRKLASIANLKAGSPVRIMSSHLLPL